MACGFHDARQVKPDGLDGPRERGEVARRVVLARHTRRCVTEQALAHVLGYVGTGEPSRKAPTCGVKVERVLLGVQRQAAGGRKVTP
ncbi:MAG: hypothetical protein ABIQ16_16930 [Polyangiaceae bacterium]